MPDPLTHLSFCPTRESLSHTLSKSWCPREPSLKGWSATPHLRLGLFPETGGWPWRSDRDTKLKIHVWSLECLLCNAGQFSFCDRNLLCASEDWFQGLRRHGCQASLLKSCLKSGNAARGLECRWPLSRARSGKQENAQESITAQVPSPDSGGSKILALMWNFSVSLSLLP